MGGSTSSHSVPAKTGQRVVRGPNWRWGNQDGGEGNVGTIELIGSGDSGRPEGTVVVQWDSGRRANYRSGCGDAFDLRLFDNAPTGVVHEYVICDECKEQPLIGVRWKCLSCPDYDLCSNCYMGGKHILTHAFKRLDEPGAVGVDVPKRQGLSRIEARGMFVGAKVTRGPDWTWGDQDGGEGGVGILVSVNGLDDKPGRSIANVHWYKTGKTNVYRFGHRGKMDLKFVDAVSGGYYYKDQLPVIGGASQASADDPSIIKVGDQIKIELDAEVLESMQIGHGGWNSEMKKYIGKIGTVKAITPQGDVSVLYEGCNNPWTFHAAAVTKVAGTKIVPGAKVLVSGNRELVVELQKGHGGWVDDMSIGLGKIGKVLKIDDDGDVRIKVEGHNWTFNPKSLTLVPGAPLEPVTEEDKRDDSHPALQLMILQHLLERLSADDSKDLVAEAAKGDVEAVKKILMEHPDKVNDKSSEKTALQVATYQGHKEIVELLLEANANMELRDDDGDTALHYAAFGNEPEILELLLKKGASVNAINKKGLTTVHVAVGKQHVTCVQLMIKYNCNVNMQDAVGDTPLHDAIGTENLEIVDLLIGVESLNFNLCNKRGFNVLHHAALKGSNFIVEHLLAKTMHLVNISKDDGFTALHLASLNGHRLVAETLLVKGNCNVDAKNKSDQTPLFLAVRQANCGTIELLVDKGADVNAQDDDGDTPLHMALIKSFMSQTTTTETTDTDAPVIHEIMANLRSQKLAEVYLAIACFLTQKGADLHHKNHKGKAPLDFIPVPKVKDIVIFYSSLKSNAAQTNSSPMVRRSISADTSLCSICYEGPATVSFEPCGHKVSCEECCIRMKKCIKCQAIIMKKVSSGGQLISNPGIQTSTDKLNDTSEVEESQRCAICMDASKDVAFLCGHRACSDCAQNLQTCHICRKPITQKINLY